MADQSSACPTDDDAGDEWPSRAAAAAAADATLWLWRLTWGPGGLLIAAVTAIYVVAMLAVPELRSAITAET